MLTIAVDVINRYTGEKNRRGLLDYEDLIAHTAEDSLAIYTGLYPDRHGMPVSNSYKTFHPDGTTEPDGSFVYWTSPVYNTATLAPSTTDSAPSMVYSDPASPRANGNTTPAPWVPGAWSSVFCAFSAVVAGAGAVVVAGACCCTPVLSCAGASCAKTGAATSIELAMRSVFSI